MGVFIDSIKLLIISEPKILHFDLSKDADNSFNYEIESIIKHNEFLAELKEETRLVNYSPNEGLETKIMNTETIKPMNHTNLFSTCCRDYI